MTSVKYENSLGTSLMLNDGHYFVNGEDLRNFSWGYEVLGRPSGFGGTVKGFSRPYEEKPLRVAVRGTKEEFLQRMNALQALTQPDVLLKKPGRIRGVRLIWRPSALAYIEKHVVPGEKRRASEA